MPPKSEAQRRFMGAELSRKRSGQKTQTGMSDKQLSGLPVNRRVRNCPPGKDHQVGKATSHGSGSKKAAPAAGRARAASRSNPRPTSRPARTPANTSGDLGGLQQRMQEQLGRVRRRCSARNPRSRRTRTLRRRRRSTRCAPRRCGRRLPGPAEHAPGGGHARSRVSPGADDELDAAQRDLG